MASRSLGSLTIDLIAKIAGFEQGMDKAARVAAKRSKEIEASAKRAGAVMGAAFAAGATAAGVALYKLTADAVEYADQLDELSQKLGVGADQLSKWGYAAQMSGTDLDGLSRGIGLLSKNMAAALDGDGSMGRLFDTLGIAVKDAEGKLRDVEDVLPEIADRFKALDNTTTETALAMQLFGKSGADLLEFLNRGGAGIRELGDDLAELGGVIDNETAAAAAEFKDELDRLRQVGVGLGASIAAQLLGPLKDTAAEFRTLVREGDFVANTVAVISGAMRAGVGVIEGYNNAVARTAIAMETVANAAQGFAEMQRNFGPGGLFDTGSMREGMKGVVAAFEQGQRDLDALTARQNSPWRNVVSGASTVAAGGGSANEDALNRFFAGSSSGGKGKARNDEADHLRDLKRSREELERMIQAREDARREFDAWAAQLAGPVAEANFQFAVDLERLNELSRKGEVAAEDLADAQAKLRSEHEKNIKALQAQLTPAEEALRLLEEETAWLLSNEEGQRRLAAARLLGADATQEQIDRATEYMRVNDQLAESMRNWDELNRNMADTFADVLSGSKSAKDGITDFFDNLNSQILRNITQDWADQLTDLFKGWGNSQGGDSFWGSLLGAFGFGGGRANGGWASANSMYEVNERGLEMATVRGRDYLLTGNSPVQITPHNRLAKGGMSQTNNFIVQGRIDRRTQDQLAQDVGRKASVASRRNG